MSTAQERMSTWKFESGQPDDTVGSEHVLSRPMTARSNISTSYSRASTARHSSRAGTNFQSPSYSQASSPGTSRPQTARPTPGRTSARSNLRTSLREQQGFFGEEEETSEDEPRPKSEAAHHMRTPVSVRKKLDHALADARSAYALDAAPEATSPEATAPVTSPVAAEKETGNDAASAPRVAE